jgi:hypothetical protein
MLDKRFQVTAPGGSGSGGAAPYRYDSFGNRPFRGAPFGNEYPWGRSTGAETLGDHVRHQTHNSNEMIRRFLNDATPAVEPRMYLTDTWGYGDRLPVDHHEEIAAIAPRAVLIDNTNNDYADDAEGDAIGYEGAMPVYRFLGAQRTLALDLFMGGGGHSLKPAQGCEHRELREHGVVRQAAGGRCKEATDHRPVHGRGNVRAVLRRIGGDDAVGGGGPEVREG